MASFGKKDIKNNLILITSVFIIALIIIIGLWIYEKAPDTKEIIIILIVGPIIIVLLWIYYFNQKKRDTNPNQPETLIQKAIQTNIRVSGTMRKTQSIGAFITSPIMIIGGTLILVGIGSDFEMELKYKLIIGIAVILVGIALFFVAIYLWRLGSMQSKGRIYEQEHQQTNPTQLST